MKTTHVLPPSNYFTDANEKQLFIENPLNEELEMAPQVEVGILTNQAHETPFPGVNNIWTEQNLIRHSQRRLRDPFFRYFRNSYSVARFSASLRVLHYHLRTTIDIVGFSHSIFKKVHRFRTTKTQFRKISQMGAELYKMS